MKTFKNITVFIFFMLFIELTLNEEQGNNERHYQSDFLVNNHSRKILQKALNSRRKTQMVTPDQIFRQKVDAAFKQSNDNRMKLLIINQTPHFEVPNQEGDVNYKNVKIGYGVTYKTPVGGCKNQTNSNTLTFRDVPGIVQVAQSLSNLYDEYYQNFPDTSNENITNINFDTIANKTAKVLDFYTSIRSFVIKIYQSRNNIIDSITKIQGQVINLRTDEMDMLRFYDLEDKYSNIKLKSFPYEAKDPAFVYYYKSISQITVSFQINAQAVFTVVSQMANYAQIFLEAIDRIYNLGFGSQNINFLTLLEDFDAVMQLLSTLADIELELKNAVVSIKATMTNLLIFRESISESLDNISNLADLYQLKGPAFINSAWSDVSIQTQSVALILLSLFAAIH